MHLRSISLKGFKSFPDRTRLEFAPGVSVVVGPNGSGKSNITDAVLWALGEQSPLAVRGQTMQDVIFAGGHGLPSRSSAEVEVVIDNSDGTLESPFSELSVVRKLDRSGEGEYRLNGARCRLADVVEALSDTGLGKEMHSVVSQGRVEAIIHSKPRDRRLMIEEAAGLGKHRRRRRRAHLKLERTSENLARALDVEREARSRLRPLKRQAEAAELHERLERQSLEARLELARESLRLARRELSSAETAASSSRELRDGAEAELAEVAERRERAEEAFAEHSRLREALSSAAWGARAASDAISIRLERAGDTRAEAEARAARWRGELRALEAGSAETAVRGRLEALESELAALDSETEEQEGPEDHIAAARAKHGQALRALRDMRAAAGASDGFIAAAEAALDRVADAITAAEALALAAGEGPGGANDARAAERALQRAQLEAEIRAERRFAEEGERGRAARLEHLRARLAGDEWLAGAAALAAEGLQAAFEAVEARREHLHAELAADEETGARTAAELKECARSEAELQARLRELSEGVTSTEVRAQQLRDAEAEASGELTGIARALEVEPEPSQKALPEDEREQLEARVARLARRREQLGAVNPLAKAEYEEAVEHVGDLERQRDDLDSAIRELERLIRETDRRIRESFEQTFEQAARNFEELVEHLFPGGRGRLRLVTPEAPRPVIGGEPAEGEAPPGAEAGEAEDEEEPPADEPGVEVEVTPAGKATKRLSLLSGGEKSLVALAFMFAVFLARPCPFYILDEVEAALDDLNIDRFLQLLRRYSDRAQFIVVTHQKRTMDAADCLYGVSMGKDGVSKVVSRRLAPGEGALEAVAGDGAEEAA